MTIDLGVLISGRGSNLGAILDAVAAGSLDARVRVVISNKAGAGGLEIARAAGVPTVVIPHGAHPDRASFDAALVAALREAGAECVVLAGFMRLVTPVLLDAFPYRVVNIHPSLLPAFPGVDAQAQALAYGARITGCTVHLVDAGTDTGPVLAQAAVPVLEGDDRDALAARILAREHELLVLALGWLAQGLVEIEAGAAGKRPIVRVRGAATALGDRGAAVTSKHFDVVVLGRSIGALTAAALLARRDFTVLLLGQGERPPAYRLDRRTLLRRSFTMLAATCPTWRKVVVELAQSQTWKRRLEAASPMMQVLAPRRRLDVPPDMALFGREIDREYPELRRLVDDLYAELARVNGSADEAFESDAVWPPGTFWERRETNRYAAMLPHVRAEPDADLLAEFPRGHAFRQIVQASVLFATHLSSVPPPFAVARLHGAWTRGLFTLARGEEEIEEFLLDRIAAYGGRCLLDDRAAALHMKRGDAAGVIIDGDTAPTGASFILTDMDGESLTALTGGEGIHKRAQREWPRITSSAGRFVVSIVVRKEGLPAPLGPESFFLPGDRPPGQRVSTAPGPGRSSPFAPRPVVRLQRLRRPDDPPGEELLVAETLLPDRGALAREDARRAVLATLAGELPFLERHLVLVDSVHDGLPVWVFENGRRRTVERASLRGASSAVEPMVRQLEVDPPGYLGLAGEPIRGPIDRTLLVGRSVLPGLGQEGQLLAAWGAARLVTRTDRKKEKMRRDMWSKVEIG